MMHKPISIRQLCLSFLNKICFDSFTTQIIPGSRIAIIGRNGSGKSSLLNILRLQLQPSEGEITMPAGITIGYVEQTINEYDNLSGGQRLNKRLSAALALAPDLLLLDEPTNHLDRQNRISLMRMLQAYQGTLIIVSHDAELLRTCVDTLWHIEDHSIREFTGSYDDYIREMERKRALLTAELSSLKRDKKASHTKLMKEQKRAATSKSKGKKSIKQKKWPTVVSSAKAQRAGETAGKKKSAINKHKHNLLDQLSNLHVPEVIVPKFALNADAVSHGTLVSITDGAIGYDIDNMLQRGINLSVGAQERLAINGRNASGKSTFLKAIIGDSDVIRTGSWHSPNVNDIGYLDQHYANLNPVLSVIDHIMMLKPDWNELEARRHLNDFLFRKNEDVYCLASQLSGGEKARLSLALIAAKPPKLLLLDEITNNLDLETKAHVVQVLKCYPGAMIVVSHEQDFLDELEKLVVYDFL